MIPVRLELSNFLSYRQTAVLDFNGLHLACISGANGAGKSTILDSITWALFGQCRSKSEDDLINRIAAAKGETAEVRYTFQLEGVTYRIIRRKKIRKPTVLELQMAVGDDHWKAMSESKIRETQTAVEKLLRMNYDTFTNASFLLQGKADEFTNKNSSKRKEILVELLGVSVWERYKETAVERRKGEENRLALLEAQMGDIAHELAEEPERQAALSAARTELSIIAEKRALKEERLNHLRLAEAVLQQHKQTVQTLADTLSRAQRTLQEREKLALVRQKERDEFAAILAQTAVIQANYAAWQKADDVWQGWQKKAEQFNSLQQQKRPHELALTQERSRLEQEQRQLEAIAQAVVVAEAEQGQAQVKLAQQQAQQAQTNDKLAQLVAQEQAWHEARTQLQQLEAERQLLSQEAGQLQIQARRVQAMIDERTAVQRNQQEAETQISDIAAKIAAIASQYEQFGSYRAELDNLQQNDQPRLREQMNKMKERLDRLEAESGSTCPLCGQPLSDDHRTAVLEELRSEGALFGDRWRQNKMRIDWLNTEIPQLETAIKQSPRLEKESQIQQQRQAKAVARLAEIEQAVAEWQAGGAGRLAEMEPLLADTTAVQALKQRVTELGTAVSQKTPLEKESQALQKEIATLEARQAEIARQLADWQTHGQEALTAVRQTLHTQAYAPAAQNALAELNVQLQTLAYSATDHQTAKQAREALAQAPTQWQELQKAMAAVQPLETTIADLAQQIAEQNQTIAQLTSQLETAQAQLTEMQAQSKDLRAVEDEVFALREAENVLQRKEGAARQRLDVLEDLRQQAGKYLDEQTAVKQAIQRLKLLEKSCGRDGVQALLIEHALPEIEERANDLLERLTNGEMRVTFETQKQLKTRDALAETLDIRIIDNVGERPYENFSGGEQFRVNFAIRIALSQMLSRRAGARLQTLVIDEGFGSQDPNGRQRLVEAINTIQDDFARILVITHIDELRDAFPNRIEIEKSSTGSKITVV